MHIACVYFTGIEPWRSHTQAYPSFTVTETALNYPHIADRTVFASDFLAFVLIILLAVWSKAGGLEIPMILRAIAKDATRYFLVIFTSHFVLVMTLNLGRVSATVSLPRVYLLTLNLGNDPTSSSFVSQRRPPLNIAILTISFIILIRGNVV